ncbi:Retrovirus-related Pol polyprotein from transposon RE2 [Vitis vinifera]|uniref:Retrovirus-related Pol polyprotein from transposon RE2 n=1 Tax=Vitis vinifera TaxID=29760 RepID=A0A438EXE0_VITVI|nr:Retrovirus-related Pol polyprotein from transposon RE2 [Vitis vinifera]
MDVTFFETQPYYPKNDIQGENSTQEYQFWDLESFKPGPNPSKLPGNNAPDGTVDSELENDILNMPIAWRKGVRSCTQHPIGNIISYDKLSPTFRAFTSSITEIQVPQNIQEAFKYPKWKAAVNKEVRALEKNGTWEITDLPRGKKPVGCKWIFTVKYKADGNVDRYKARLVAKGFTQSYGIDYQETFAPVAKLNTVRVLLSLAANLDWSLHQLDVKNAFLNGDLEEEVYMDIPVGLETTSNFNKVCRLRKSLYGLKQSPRAWFERFTKVVKGYGFVQCQSDHTLFVKQFPVIIVYVDDIILIGDHEEKIDLLKKLLTKEFEIKDLGNLKYFLGMEIARSKKGIAVSQRKYVLDLLNETRMLGCKPAETPMDTTVKLEESDGSAPVDKGRYQRLVRKLIYLSHTRPDIGFSVSVVSQFMNNPTKKHMTAVIRILRYLKMTPGKGLFFQRTTKKEIEIFSDADWAGSVTDRRSTSGYCSFVWGNLVTWRSKKQSVVARSSAEAEFRAMAQGICEGIWLNRLLEELRIPLKHPMVLYCDNQAAISIAKNPVHHDRTKHVEIDRHFIKEKIEEGVFKVSYTPTNCQTADILTKALARVNFEDLTEKLGMINIYNAA